MMEEAGDWKLKRLETASQEPEATTTLTPERLWNPQRCRVAENHMTGLSCR